MNFIGEWCQYRKTFYMLYTKIEYITCCLYLLKTFPNITVLCNDTAVCEPQEFCSVTGTKYGESNGICQTGNIKIRIILLFALQ